MTKLTPFSYILLSFVTLSTITVQSAFLPHPPQTPEAIKSCPFGSSTWGVAIIPDGKQQQKQTMLFSTKKGEAVIDENFDDVDIVRLMGLRRVKKMIRKNKRKVNQRMKEETPKLKPKQQQQKSVKKTPKKAAPAPAESDEQPLRIIIAGAPASGKGTQCDFIQQQYGVVHLSTGDMLRAAVADGTPVGKVAKEYMDSGKLVPDDVIIGVVKERLSKSDCQEKGWLLDGFPRTRAQADALAAAGVTADCFLFLNVPDEILVDRVVGRRTDPETGKIYHMVFSPPEDPEVLERLVQRSDDTEEKVKVRLKQFHENVDNVKGCYEDISVEVNGTMQVDAVAERVREALDKCRAVAA